jgi:ring-1,2-phenylacetyl-CoA epoxidase subunit PaaA
MRYPVGVTQTHAQTGDPQAQAFYAHVGGGGKVEADDWMPDDYRAAVLKFVEMHANSELMGVLPEREWILRAPTLRRKLALTSKVQDEVGHAQLLYRVAEDLGKPRDQMLADLLAGKTKFHNVFHYPTASWADVGIIAWLVDAAAIVSQQALRDSSYAPYARTMKKICWEESVHIMHGRDVVLTMMNGTDAQRALVQDALDRWWGPLMQMHGPPTNPETDRDLIWKIKAKGNEQLRQEFLSIYVPRIWELGLTIPDPALRHNDDEGRWHYTEPDWDELRSVVTGHGPKSQERLQFRRDAADVTQWVRDAILGPAQTAVA